MYPSFSTDFMKIVIFSALVAIFFSFAGWQAGSIYFGLFTEKKMPPVPSYIFPVSKVKPLTTGKTPGIEEKKSIAPQQKPLLKTKKPVPVLKKPITQKKTPPKNPTMILLTYPAKTDADTQSQDKQTPIIYSIQTGIFKNKMNADKNYTYLLDQGYTPVMVALNYQQQLKIYAVRMGKFKDRETAKAAMLEFKKKEKKDAMLAPLYSTKVLIEICKNSIKNNG
jgi:hypothetical protein